MNPNKPSLLWRTYAFVMRRLKPILVLNHVTTRPLQPEPTFQALPGITIRFASREELAKACQRNDLPLSEAWLDESFKRGDLCTAAFEGERIVGFTWNSTSTAPHVDGMWVEFKPPYRYGYKSFTCEDYRGKRINNALLEYSDRYYIEHGWTHSIGFVETHNFSSIRSSTRNPGRKFVGKAGYIKVFGKVFSFRTLSVKKLGFRFVLNGPGEQQS